MLGFDTVRGGSLTYSDTDTRAIKSHRHYQKDLFLGKQTLNTARRKGVKKKKKITFAFIYLETWRKTMTSWLSGHFFLINAIKKRCAKAFLT